MLHRSIDEFFQLSEGDDFIEFALDLALPHAEDGTGEKSVLAASQLGMEARTDFEERADTAANFSPARGGPRNSRQNLQQSCLARTVAADEAEDFTFAHFERNVFQGPERLFFFSAK